MQDKIYKTPREIKELLGITNANLKKNRLSGNLKDIKWTPKRGKPYYELNEVKALFYK